MSGCSSLTFGRKNCWYLWFWCSGGLWS